MQELKTPPAMSNNVCFYYKMSKNIAKIPCKSYYFTGYADTETTSRESLTFLQTTPGHAGSTARFRSLEDAPLFIASLNNICCWQGSTAAPCGKRGSYQIEPVFICSAVAAGPLLPLSQRKLRY